MQILCKIFYTVETYNNLITKIYFIWVYRGNINFTK